MRFVLSDMAVVGIANEQPRTMEQLRRVRGVDQRHLRGSQGKGILAAVEEGRAMPDDERHQPRRDDVDRRHRPAVALLAAWVSQLARDQRIDAGLLATRSDLVAFLNGDPDARLASGWRQELVGRPARRLVEGELALAFDGHRGLALERRSHDVVAPDLPKPSARWAGGD
ncbi:MAG: HRDC domain-containing protein [Actinomycetota bacterium]|nr:HRDC domain-containing protein [Actinomycetota bacterium]